MKQLKNFIILIFILLCVACQGTTESVNDKQHAEDLLNQNRFVQAKDMLKKLHLENLADDEVALMLATAYAGSVGLNVVDAWRMFEPMFFQEFSSNLLEETNGEKASSSEQFEKETYKFFASLAADFNILGRLPSLTKAGRIEINEALLVLDSIKADKPNFFRAKLYGVFLNLFQFSGVLRDSFPNLPKESDFEFAKVVCEFNPGLFFQNIDLGLNYLNSAAAGIDAVAGMSSLRPNVKLHLLKESAAKLLDLRSKSEGALAGIFASKSAIDKAMCETQ